MLFEAKISPPIVVDGVVNVDKLDLVEIDDPFFTPLKWHVSCDPPTEQQEGTRLSLSLSLTNQSFVSFKVQVLVRVTSIGGYQRDDIFDCNEVIFADSDTFGLSLDLGKPGVAESDGPRLNGKDIVKFSVEHLAPPTFSSDFV
eukprot:m.23204 g.23204  ORF g.23204 m.23204 type:complete len:143 (-) comp8952_c0_seq3:346-774(-)